MDPVVAPAATRFTAALLRGASDPLNTLVNGWVGDYASNGYSSSNLKPSDLQVMNTCQIETIGAMVWNRTLAVGSANGLPGLAANAKLRGKMQGLEGQLLYVKI